MKRPYLKLFILLFGSVVAWALFSNGEKALVLGSRAEGKQDERRERVLDPQTRDDKNALAAVEQNKAVTEYRGVGSRGGKWALQKKFKLNVNSMKVKAASSNDISNSETENEPSWHQDKRVLLKDIPMPDVVRRKIENELSGGGAPVASSAPDESEDRTNEKNVDRTDAFSYQVVEFLPGLNQNQEPIRDVPESFFELDSRVKGPPDYSLASKVPQYDRLISLGHGGSITFEVIDGFVVDHEGPDFMVFENPFVVAGTNGAEVYAETAVVSVSDVLNDESFVMFPCNSTTPNYVGCAGVTPVRYESSLEWSDVGGDPFDLASLGLTRIRYIRIEDTGDNKKVSAIGAEGFDLDALGIIHFERSLVAER